MATTSALKACFLMKFSQRAYRFRDTGQSKGLRFSTSRISATRHSSSLKEVCVFVVQSCLTLCHPMDCSPPRSSVHGILQTKALGWVTMPPSRGSSWPRDQTWISSTAGRFFTISATISYMLNEKNLIIDWYYKTQTILCFFLKY